MSGIEFHPYNKYQYHILAINVPYPFPFSESGDPNKCIEEIRAAGGITWLGHPFWSGFEFNPHISALKGLAAVEVYNTTCDDRGYGTSFNEWSFMLTQGWCLPALAVDDIHAAEGDGLFGGWTWLKMPSLTPDNVTKAIATGACYSSTGPEIHDFRVEDGKIKIRCSPAAKILFMGGPRKGTRALAKGNQYLESFEARMNKDMKYVRAIVTDSAGRSAWSQPILANDSLRTSAGRGENIKSRK